MGVFWRGEAALSFVPEKGREKRKRMTKLQIISKLWSAIYDLVFLVKGTPTKSLEEIEADLDIVEYACRKYARKMDLQLIVCVPDERLQSLIRNVDCVYGFRRHNNQISMMHIDKGDYLKLMEG